MLARSVFETTHFERCKKIQNIQNGKTKNMLTRHEGWKTFSLWWFTSWGIFHS